MPLGHPSGSPSASRGHAPPRTALAWLVILLLVGFIAARQALAEPARDGDGDTRAFLTEIQVQVQFGLTSLLERGGAGPDAERGIPAFREMERLYGGGSRARRLRFAVVAAETGGPGKALDVLREAEEALRRNGEPPTDRQRRAAAALRTLYAGGGTRIDPAAAARLDPGDRTALLDELGWLGRLALAPRGAPGRGEVMAVAERRAAVYFGAFALLLLLLGAGLLGALVFWLRAAARRGASLRFAPGSAPSGIHAETFAVWLLLYLLLSRGTVLAASALGDPGLLLALSAGALPFSLLALGWPVLRGVPWARVREDVGLFLPASPLRDAAAGLASWVMGLPAMAAGMAATVLLVQVRAGLAGPSGADPLGSPGMPSHPAVDEAARGGSWPLLFFLAAVMAPVLEETFFRGVLYRHLRDATGRAGRFLSIGVSALVSGFLFAAIHPQGWMFIPPLMGVAWALVQAREWRGSLLAPMVAHGFHNGALFAGLWFLSGPG